MRRDPYEEMAAEYREKVPTALREGGVGSASAARAVREWSDNLRAAWAAGRSPRSAARDVALYVALYEGLSYRGTREACRAARRSGAEVRALVAAAALLAACGDPFVSSGPEPAGAGADPCPDERACDDACLGGLGLRGACGWAWGEPACVCGPEPCGAAACYEGEGVPACGRAPGGGDAAACLEAP